MGLVRTRAQRDELIAAINEKAPGLAVQPSRLGADDDEFSGGIAVLRSYTWVGYLSRDEDPVQPLGTAFGWARDDELTRDTTRSALRLIAIDVNRSVERTDPIFVATHEIFSNPALATGPWSVHLDVFAKHIVTAIESSRLNASADEQFKAIYNSLSESLNTESPLNVAPLSQPSLSLSIIR